MYGKIVNGELTIAPSELELEDGTIIYNFNRTIDKMKEYGFKATTDSNPLYNVETQHPEPAAY